MAFVYSVHGLTLRSRDKLHLPSANAGGQDSELSSEVIPDPSIVERATRDRELQSDSANDVRDAEERADRNTANSEPDIQKPKGWWGVRADSEQSARAGITYNGFLFEILLGKEAVRHADPTDSDGAIDALIRYAPDPEVSFQFPLGNSLERMIVPLLLMLAKENLASVHAGGVTDSKRGVGWIWTGPSGAGKSSIVADVISKIGLRPCADETAVLRVEEENGAVTMLPGAPWLRLYEEPSAPKVLENAESERRSAFAASGELPDPIDKRWYRFHDEVYPTRAVPLQRWWLLDPDAEVSEPSVEEMSGGEAATSLLAETIDFDQRDEAWARRRFRNTMAVARRVPAAVIRYDKRRQTPGDIADVILAEMDR